MKYLKKCKFTTYHPKTLLNGSLLWVDDNTNIQFRHEIKKEIKRKGMRISIGLREIDPAKVKAEKEKRENKE